MQRVTTYIDGFNLYFGMKSKNWRRYYWLDLVALSQSMLKPDQTLSHVHYFTTRIRSNGHNAPDAKRQNTYLDALATLPALTRHEGHYLEKTRCCRRCGATWPDYEEKMTDVNIASQLLVDAFDDRYDTAIIMSGDSDLTTPVRRVRERFPNKRVVIAQPPNRHSQELNRAANGFFSIGEDKLRNSQLPNQVVSKTGFPLLRPAHWA